MLYLPNFLQPYFYSNQLHYIMEHYQRDNKKFFTDITVKTKRFFLIYATFFISKFIQSEVKYIVKIINYLFSCFRSLSDVSDYYFIFFFSYLHRLIENVGRCDIIFQPVSIDFLKTIFLYVKNSMIDIQILKQLLSCLFSKFACAFY